MMAKHKLLIPALLTLMLFGVLIQPDRQGTLIYLPKHTYGIFLKILYNYHGPCTQGNELIF